MKAKQFGALAVFDKPVDIDEFRQVVNTSGTIWKVKLSTFPPSDCRSKSLASRWTAPLRMPPARSAPSCAPRRRSVLAGLYSLRLPHN